MISVIIPTYNCREYLGDLFKSLRIQDVDLEIILVDDGSTDGTYKDVEKLKPDKFVRLNKNKGSNYARRIGLSLAVGDYIFISDADAELYENCLSTLLKAINSKIDDRKGYYKGYSEGILGLEGYDIAYCNLLRAKQELKGMPFNLRKLQEANYISMMSLVRRYRQPTATCGNQLDKIEILKPEYFDLDIKRAQDWDVWLTLAEKGFRFKWVNKKLFWAEGGRKGSIGAGTYGTAQEWVEKVKSKHGLC